MVRDALDRYLHAVLDEDDHAAAGSIGGRRAKVEQNGLGNSAQLVLLGLHSDAGKFTLVIQYIRG